MLNHGNSATPRQRRSAGLLNYSLIIASMLACGLTAAQTAEEAAIPIRKGSENKGVAGSGHSLYTAQLSEEPLGILRKRVTDVEAKPAVKKQVPENPAMPPSAPKPAAEKATAKTGTESRQERKTPEDSAKAAPGKSSAPTRKSDPSGNLTADLAALEVIRTNKNARSDEAAAKSSSDTIVSSGAASDDDAVQSSLSSAVDDSTAVNEAEPRGDVAFAPTLSGTAAATAPPPSPNLYLPQTTPPRQGGLLSRLFKRNSSRQRGTAATASAAMHVPLNFTSDHVNRSSTDVCPAVLPGFGINGVDIPIGSEDSYRLTSSLPTDFRPTDLVLLPPQYCHYGKSLYLRREAAGALCQMIAAAQQEGLRLQVVSAFRDYSHQLRLYNQAVARKGPDQKSVARPGRSEHFLGTTVDLTNNDTHLLKRSFGDTPEGRWLAANAARFGWKMTVMAGEGRRSHNDEPWHLRYLGSSLNNASGISPIAQQSSASQRRDVFGSIGRALGLRR